MIPLTRLSLRLRIFLFFALLGLGGVVLLSAGLIFGYSRLGDPAALGAFVLGGVVGGFAILALTTWIWVLFDEHVARPVEHLAVQMRARAHAGVGGDIDAETAGYLGDLAPAAAAMTQSLSRSRNALSEAVGRETERLGRETAWLAALLAEVPDGVIFCGADHRVVLYNARAQEILGGAASLGLNRPVSDVLLPGPVEQAYDRLKSPAAAGAADILLATRSDARLIEARMRLLRLGEEETGNAGYLLSFRDVSAGLSVAAERARILNEAIELAEAALADASPDAGMQASLADLKVRKAPTDTQWWPMETVAAPDLGAALAARLDRHGLSVAHDLPSTLIRCDGFAITRLLERIAVNWATIGARDFRLNLTASPDGVRLAVRATGTVPEAHAIDAWLDQPLSPSQSRFSGRDVLQSHASRIEVREGIGLILPAAARTPASSATVEFDFDLLSGEIPTDLAYAELKQLSFVVFDTETTGLDPERDEICQIAGLRVVNGRCRNGEVFDRLVDPGRPIPAASTAVHHISDAMVAGAPGVAETLSEFHDFTGNAVLVAHNAPFDMTFLKRREGEIGKRFDQPVLDTVLLSAILFGQSADHTLDALCTRLDIKIPEAERHTALGDARATAEAMLRMFPMLEGRNLSTLGAVIREFDRHARLIAHLN